MTIPELLVIEGKWPTTKGPHEPWGKYITCSLAFDNHDDWRNDEVMGWWPPEHLMCGCTGVWDIWLRLATGDK